MRAAVPPAIVAWLGLPWRRDVYALESDPVDMRRMVTDFYQLYSDVQDFPALCEANRGRFPIELERPGDAAAGQAKGNALFDLFVD